MRGKAGTANRAYMCATQQEPNSSSKAGYKKGSLFFDVLGAGLALKFWQKEKQTFSHMNEPILITGQSEEEMALHLTAHLQQHAAALHHTIALQQGHRRVLVEVDIDPGGGFESGYATTRLSAPVTLDSDFAFTIHPEGFLADFAKLFGLQDEVIGYPEFDDKVIIKTNNKQKVKALFADEGVRKTLAALTQYNLQLQAPNETDTVRLLLLEVEEGITEPAALMNLYRTFMQLWQGVQAKG